MKRLSALALSLAFIFPAIHSRPAQGASSNPETSASQKMTIKSLTGNIQIKLADGTLIGVFPGKTLPEIPAGAEVVVVSGEAVFESGGVVVSATTGDSFSFTSSGPGQVGIAATGSKTELSVVVGGTEAKVKSGAAVAVSGAGTGSGELKVTKGAVDVTRDGKTRTLSNGQSTQVKTQKMQNKKGDSKQKKKDGDTGDSGDDFNNSSKSNHNQNEETEKKEGIADDVSPSSP